MMRSVHGPGGSANHPCPRHKRIYPVFPLSPGPLGTGTDFRGVYAPDTGAGPPERPGARDDDIGARWDSDPGHDPVRILQESSLRKAFVAYYAILLENFPRSTTGVNPFCGTTVFFDDLRWMGRAVARQ
jgi:hypothetical protein